MKRLFLSICMVAVLVSCRLTKPTYLDVHPETLDKIAAILGKDTEAALAEDRDKLRAELSKELGMKVEKIWNENNKVTAEIEPATDAALDTTFETGMKDPGQPKAWLTGLLAGCAVLFGGLIGKRGKKERK